MFDSSAFVKHLFNICSHHLVNYGLVSPITVIPKERMLDSNIDFLL